MPSADDYDPTGIEYHIIPTFNFACGTTLPDVRVAYRSHNPSSTLGTILIPTCYGGLINTTLTFSTAPNDCLKDYHVIVVAMLGNGESSSPSNKKMFPLPGELRYSDCIRSQRLLLRHLNIDALEAVIGFSMGAQQAYHWGVMYPGFSKRIIPICGSARTSAHNYAFLEGPIGALTNAMDYLAWNEVKTKIANGEDVGPKLREVRPERGLRAFGRAYSAWLTSASWFREGWYGKKEGGLGFEGVESWIVGGCEAGFVAWDAEDLLVLGRMWQLGDVGLVIPSGEGEPDPEDALQAQMSRTLGGAKGDDETYEKALGEITAKVLVMPCRTDQYFPPEDGEIEMKYLKKGTWAPIESIWGHVAGGGMNPKDVEWMNGRIGEFMAEE
jgi:homoserine acetyltransferase